MTATRRMCVPVFLFAYWNSDGTVADLLPSSVIGAEKGTGPSSTRLVKTNSPGFLPYSTVQYHGTALFWG